MLRSVLSVFAGYITAVLGVSTFFAITLFVGFGGMPADPASFHPPGWLYALEIGFSPFLAAAGGWVCAWLARREERRHGLALAGLMFALGLLSAAMEAGMKPLWSSLAVAALGAVGAYGGAVLRARWVRS